MTITFPLQEPDKIHVRILPYIVYIALIHSAYAGRDQFPSDLNKDGKIDFLEIYSEGILVERREDLDFNGSFDRQTVFTPEAPKEYFKVILENKNGKNPKKRISFWNDDKLKRTFTLTQIDENNDGKWDKEFQSSSDLSTHKDECETETEIGNLAGNSLEAAKLSDEYVKTSWGHRIHKSCLDNGKKDFFLKHSEIAINKGLSCLQKLGSEGGMGAAKNHASLSNILKQKYGVQVLCNDNKYNWGKSTIAHATLTADEKNTVLTHPGIAFNPKFVSDYKTQGKSGELEFQRTMFHEQLHNLGYPHGEDVEYAYTCEKCCFPSEKDPKDVTEASCKVCSGNYNGQLEINYLKDITAFSEATYSNSQALTTSFKYVKANPGDAAGISFIALNIAGVFDPVGPHLADIMLKSGEHSEENTERFKKALSYKDSSLHKAYSNSSRTTAEALYESYVSENPLMALQILRAGAPQIKAELAKKNTDSDAKFVSASVKDTIKRVIYDVWLNKHYGKLRSPADQAMLNDEAYEVAKLYNLN